MRRRELLVLCVALAGCTGGGGDSGSGDGDGAGDERDDTYLTAFDDALAEADLEVLSLEVVQGVVELAYVPAEASEDGVEESIRDVGFAFYQRVRGGWDVDRLDAEVHVDDEVVATWEMRRAWIEAYLDGELSREELEARVEASVEEQESGATSRRPGRGPPRPRTGR